MDKKFGFEVKETAYESDYLKMKRLMENLPFNKGRVITRNVTVEFENLVWGGMIR